MNNTRLDVCCIKIQYFFSCASDNIPTFSQFPEDLFWHSIQNLLTELTGGTAKFWIFCGFWYISYTWHQYTPSTSFPLEYLFRPRFHTDYNKYCLLKLAYQRLSSEIHFLENNSLNLWLDIDPVSRDLVQTCYRSGRKIPEVGQNSHTKTLYGLTNNSDTGYVHMVKSSASYNVLSKQNIWLNLLKNQNCLKSPYLLETKTKVVF